MYYKATIMPRTVKSEKAKSELVEALISATGHVLIHKDHHADWYRSTDNSIEIYLTYSQGTYWRQPWYDIEPADLKKLASHPAAFIIFVLDYSDQFLVVPAKELSERLSTITPNADDGRYELTIYRHSNEFGLIPGWKLKPYLKKLDQIPKPS
jgi:hypothetical protein